jgi:hypothetical protein
VIGLLYVFTFIIAIIVIGQTIFHIKKRLIKELIVSLFIMGIVMFFSYGELLNWNLPGPDTFIRTIFDPLADIVFGTHPE